MAAGRSGFSHAQRPAREQAVTKVSVSAWHGSTAALRPIVRGVAQPPPPRSHSAPLPPPPFGPFLSSPSAAADPTGLSPHAAAAPASASSAAEPACVLNTRASRSASGTQAASASRECAVPPTIDAASLTAWRGEGAKARRSRCDVTQKSVMSAWRHSSAGGAGVGQGRAGHTRGYSVWRWRWCSPAIAASCRVCQNGLTVSSSATHLLWPTDAREHAQAQHIRAGEGARQPPKVPYVHGVHRRHGGKFTRAAATDSENDLRQVRTSEPRDIKRLLCGDGCGANLTPLRSALSGETFARFSHSTLSLYALSVAARAPDRAVRMHSTACRRSAWAGAAPVDAPSLSPSPT